MNTSFLGFLFLPLLPHFLTLFPGITPQINWLHPGPNLRVCWDNGEVRQGERKSNDDVLRSRFSRGALRAPSHWGSSEEEGEAGAFISQFLPLTGGELTLSKPPSTPTPLL